VDDWEFIRKVENQNRYAMHQTKQITKKTHTKFMNMALKNSDYHYWKIIYKNKMVGITRIYKTDFGYAILKKYQGNGIGQRTHKPIFQKAKKLGLKKLIADIKTNSPVALHVALKGGFKMTGLKFKHKKPYSYILEYDLLDHKRKQ